MYSKTINFADNFQPNQNPGLTPAGGADGVKPWWLALLGLPLTLLGCPNPVHDINAVSYEEIPVYAQDYGVYAFPKPESGQPPLAIVKVNPAYAVDVTVQSSSASNPAGVVMIFPKSNFYERNGLAADNPGSLTFTWSVPEGIADWGITDWSKFVVTIGDEDPNYLGHEEDEDYVYKPKNEISIRFDSAFADRNGVIINPAAKTLTLPLGIKGKTLYSYDIAMDSKTNYITYPSNLPAGGGAYNYQIANMPDTEKRWAYTGIIFSKNNGYENGYSYSGTDSLTVSSTLPTNDPNIAWRAALSYTDAQNQNHSISVNPKNHPDVPLTMAHLSEEGLETYNGAQARMSAAGAVQIKLPKVDNVTTPDIDEASKVEITYPETAPTVDLTGAFDTNAYLAFSVRKTAGFDLETFKTSIQCGLIGKMFDEQYVSPLVNADNAYIAYEDRGDYYYVKLPFRVTIGAAVYHIQDLTGVYFRAAANSNTEYEILNIIVNNGAQDYPVDLPTPLNRNTAFESIGVVVHNTSGQSVSDALSMDIKGQNIPAYTATGLFNNNIQTVSFTYETTKEIKYTLTADKKITKKD
jgi:hypothetical protein